MFRGTRVPIANVLASLKAGFDLEQMREAYPFLTQGLVDEAVKYGPRQFAKTTQRRASPYVLVSSERVALPTRRK